MKILRSSLIAAAGILCLFSVEVLAQDSDLLSDFAVDDIVQSDVQSQETAVEDEAPEASSTTILQVRLQNDGKLSGRLQLAYATGKTEPADAKVSFVRDGDLVDTIRTDEMGHFHVAGLEPGDYIATASVGSSSTDFKVNVLDYDPNADPDEMFLEGTLTPIPDGEIVVDEGIADPGCCGTCGEVIAGPLGDCVGDSCACGAEVIAEPIYGEEIIAEPIIDEGYLMDGGCCGAAAPCGGGCEPVYGFTGGGGGVGGRGLGLLGLAGLAGLAGLGGDDDDKGRFKGKVVSPFHVK